MFSFLVFPTVVKIAVVSLASCSKSFNFFSVTIPASINSSNQYTVSSAPSPAIEILDKKSFSLLPRKALL